MVFFVLTFYVRFYYSNVTHWSHLQVFCLKVKTENIFLFFILKNNEELDFSL